MVRVKCQRVSRVRTVTVAAEIQLRHGTRVSAGVAYAGKPVTGGIFPARSSSEEGLTG